MRTAPAPCRRESKAGSTPRPSTAIDHRYSSGIRYVEAHSFTTPQSRLFRNASM